MTAFVLGNGVSRNVLDPALLLRFAPVYGCNGLYRTHTPTVLVATDTPISRQIQESGYSKNNRFYTRRPMANLGANEIPKPYFGFSSGPVAVALAAMDKHYKIYMLGFDMGPDTAGKFNNLYAGTEFYKPMGASPTFTGNWCKQLIKITQDFPKTEFVRVFGDTTARIAELEKLSNLSHLSITDLASTINKEKDL